METQTICTSAPAWARFAGILATMVTLTLLSVPAVAQFRTAHAAASRETPTLSLARRLGVMPPKKTQAPAAKGPQESNSNNVVYSFENAAPGGANPGPLVRDPDGNLYGVLNNGGNHGSGAAFKVNPAGHVTLLYNFTGGADGGYPSGRLTRDGEGNLYGTTGTGGADGGYPLSRVVLDSEGNLFSTTYGGGDPTVRRLRLWRRIQARPQRPRDGPLHIHGWR